jgi:bifunctional DNA-binding transcriptional regulator/antitoxin component of YhaV-PrlF toxin-antitoxin module
MSTSKVDQKNRIVIDKKTRLKTHLKAGDIVIIEPIDDHSFKVNVLDFTPETLEDDPAWQMLQKPAKLKKYVPPEKLEEIMEETIWQE